MIRSAFLILAVIAVVVHGGVTGDRKPVALKYIGFVNRTVFPVGTRTTPTTFTSYYFLSQNAAAYSTAKDDCKNQLGEDGSLAILETKEDAGNVTALVKSSDDTGTTYWVGSKYNSETKTFVWENGKGIGQVVPWDVGHPTTRTPLTRVAAYIRDDLKLRTQFQTVSTRYICELRQ